MSDTLLHVWLNGVPIGKGRPRFTKQGRVYTPAKTTAYEAALRIEAFFALDGRSPFEGQLSVTVIGFMPVPVSWTLKRKQDAWDQTTRPVGKPDIDNIAKIALDALNGVVWKDDSQVVSLTVDKYFGLQPKIQITVRSA